MTKWEYCELVTYRDIDIGKTVVEITYHHIAMPQRERNGGASIAALAPESEAIERLGSDGWEAFSATNNGERRTWYFKRPLQS